MVSKRDQGQITIPNGFSPPLLTYRPSRLFRTLGLLSLGVGLLLIPVGNWLRYLPAVAFGIVLLIVGCVFASRKVELPYMLCREGLVFLKNGPQTCRWDEIEAIWFRTTTHYASGLAYGKEHSCVVLRQDGRRFKLTNLSEKSIRWVQQETFRSLVPKLRAQWEAGQPISFGPVSLSPTGIHSRGEVVPWEDVQSVEQWIGEIVIRRKGRRLVWKKLRAVPNLSLFYRFVQENLKSEH